MLEHLISSVSKEPEALIKKMNINTYAVLVNQCDTNSEKELSFENFNVKVFNRNERGVGKSRNLCIDNSQGDILLFSDEDIVYDKDYVKIINTAFDKYKKADLLLFNVKVCSERRTYWNKDFKKVTRFNCGRYPAYSIAIRRNSLIDAGIKYSELFGGGAKFSCGEDSIFLMNCIKSGLSVYTVPDIIGKEVPRKSTWFDGYNEKFFFDRGVLFSVLYRKASIIWAIRFVLVKKEMFTGKIKRLKAFSLLIKGIKRGKSLR